MSDAATRTRRRFWFRAQREWLMLVVLLIALALANGPLAGRWLEPPHDGTSLDGVPDPTNQLAFAGFIFRLDLALYDFAQRLSALDPDPDVVIVAIDDASVGQVGRWPWRRAVVAELVRRVSDLGARDIAIDIVFAESSTQDDPVLADVFAATRPILAVAREPFGSDGFLPLYPSRALAEDARLAHVVLTAGADGRIRGLFAEEAHLPALSLALVDRSARADPAATDAMLARGEWTARQPLMPRALRAAPAAVSAAAVLRGEVQAERIANRRVLIGATAVGIGDNFSTPLFADRSRASGVELHALATSAIANGQLVGSLQPLPHALFTASAVILLMVLLFRTPPQYALPLCAMAILLLLLGTIVAQQLGLWLQPGGLMMALALAYPLWSWRRLNAAAAGLLRHARRLEAVPTVLDRAPPFEPRGAEPIARELGRLSYAATQVRLLNQFLLDGIESLPHPVLICDPTGRILYRNRRMSAAFEAPVPAVGDDAAQWFAATFKGALPAPQSPGTDRGAERVDDRGRTWLVSLSLTLRPAAGGADGDTEERWLLQLVDITALRAAEREREEALSFLSHDLRSPQTSILAMTEGMSNGEMLDTSALRRHARRALELTDEFLAFARAGSQPMEPVDYDLVDLVTEVIDLSWQRAQASSVRLVQSTAGEPAVYHCDAGMIRRALLNLTENAIRHSPPGGEVVVALVDGGDHWLLSVADEGPGISPADRETIFHAWWQAGPQEAAAREHAAATGAPAGGSGPPGQVARKGVAGLGLAMVRRTVDRHGGTVTARNRRDPLPAGAGPADPGRSADERPGAVLEMRLPRAPAGIIFDHGPADSRTEPRHRAPGAA